MFKKTLFAAATALVVGVGAIAATSTPAAARPFFGFYFGAPCCYYQPYYYPYYYRGGYYPYRYGGQYYRHRYYRSGRWHYY